MQTATTQNSNKRKKLSRADRLQLELTSLKEKYSKLKSEHQEELNVHSKRREREFKESLAKKETERLEEKARADSITKEAVKDRGDLLRLKKNYEEQKERHEKEVVALKRKIDKQQERHATIHERVYDAESKVKKLKQEIENKFTVSLSDVLDFVPSMAASDVAKVRTALTAHIKTLKKVE